MNSLPPRLLLVRLACALLLFCSANRAIAASAKWTDIPKADLEATHCTTYPDAKAEHIFIHEKITSEHRSVHQRTKIYSVEAATLNSILNIEYPSDMKAYDLFARIVKPNGISIEYSIKDFTESNTVKTRYEKINKLTASFSSLAAGDIFEIKWIQPTPRITALAKTYYCQNTYPVRECISTIDSDVAGYGAFIFNVPNGRVENLKKNGIQITARDIPSFQDEPLSPPTRDIRGWVGIFQTNLAHSAKDPLKAWQHISSKLFDDYEFITKPTSAMKKIVAGITQGAANDSEKLNRIHEWCRTNITNLSYFDNAELAPLQEQRKFKGMWWPTTTLSRKGGRDSDINLLFGALARAAGFETRLCCAASRGYSLKIDIPLGYEFLTDQFIGVKLEDGWQLYAPGRYHVPPRLIHWTNECVPYMRCEETAVIVVTTTPSTPDMSVVHRTGQFTLDLDGNIEGDVELVYTGHPAVRLKEDAHAEIQDSFDRQIRAEITQRHPSAEIGDLHWTNLRTLQFPVTLRYHVRVPAYAELLGERLAINPNYFTKGNTRLFTAATRQHGIFFDYPLRQIDDIEIALPAGYKPDSVTPPASILDPTKVRNCDFKTTYLSDTRTLRFKRTFEQCGDGCTTFRAEAYPYIKRLSERIDTADSQIFICTPIDSQAAAQLRTY